MTLRNRILAIFTVFPVVVFAQNGTAFVNPGINLGYLFGNQGGVVFGFEISATYWPIDLGFVGVSAKYDWWGNSSTRFQFSGEIGTSFIGVSFGPSWIGTNSLKLSGYSTSVWTGLGLMPYYSYSWFTEGVDFEEIGGYLKYPAQVAGTRWGFSN